MVAALGFAETKDGLPAATTSRPAAGKEWNPGQQMVHAYLQSLGSRGSDVNLSTGAMSRPRSRQQKGDFETIVNYLGEWLLKGWQLRDDCSFVHNAEPRS